MNRILLPLLVFTTSLTCTAAVGDVVTLTDNLSGRVLKENGTTISVAVFGNPDAMPSGELVIKNSYPAPEGNLYLVKQIAEDGFNGSLVTDVSVGAELEIIGSGAFNRCTKLTSFTHAEPENLKIIGSSAFSYTLALESVNFPGAYTIGDWAFRYSNLKTARFDDVEYIGIGAFQQCQQLTTFIGGSKAKSIGNIAFSLCDVLTGFTFGPDLESLGSMAFAFDMEFKDVVVPSSLTTVSKSVFQGCGIERVFVLNPGFMDFCDDCMLLRNKSITSIYVLDELVPEVKYFLSVGGTESPADMLTNAPVSPMTDVVDLKAVSVGKYSLEKKLEGIEDLHVYDPLSGEEILPQGDLYEIAGDNVDLSYRIGTYDLLNYNQKLVKWESGIESVGTDDDQSIEYYTLTGLRVQSPGKGIYIVKSKSGVRKMVL